MSILLNQQAFQEAAQSLESIAGRMKRLREDMNTELLNLRKGFDSTAGERFFKACDDNLLKSMDGQVQVLKHISENLNEARDLYETVFKDYEELNNMI